MYGETANEFLKTVIETCRMAGGATIPASALICGARIAMLHPSKVFSPLMAGICALRLVLIPALCIAGLLLVPLPVDVRRVLILIAVQPAAMASVTLSEAFGGDSEFSTAAILATHSSASSRSRSGWGACFRLKTVSDSNTLSVHDPKSSYWAFNGHCRQHTAGIGHDNRF